MVPDGTSFSEHSHFCHSFSAGFHPSCLPSALDQLGLDHLFVQRSVWAAIRVTTDLAQRSRAGPARGGHGRGGGGGLAPHGGRGRERPAHGGFGPPGAGGETRPKMVFAHFGDLKMV